MRFGLRQRLTAGLGGVVATLLLVSAAHGATVKRLTIGQLADLSERVLVGEVVERVAHDAGRADGVQIVTDIVVRVDETLKGPKAERELRFSQVGGAALVDGAMVEQVVPGYPSFAKGERVLLFMERTSTGKLVVAGLAQGKYTVDDSGFARRDVEGLHLVGKRPIAVFASAPQNEDALPVAELARWVRGDHVRPLRVKRPRTKRVSTIESGAER